MSAIVNEPTSIIVPSTPTPGVAVIPSFNATISPKVFSVEARLDLSLDDLIKERKKEIKKEKKHESVKKETLQLPNQKKDSATKKAQSVKRNALVNKNRGLPALSASSNANGSASNGNGGNASKSAKKKKKPAPKTVVGKKTAAANKQIAVAMQQQQQNKNKQNKKPVANANTKNAGRNSASPKAVAPQQQQQKKKQKPQRVQVIQQQQQQQSKKKKNGQQQQQQQQQPTKSNKAHANKNSKGGSIKTLAVVTKEQARKVVRSSNSKAANIRITIKQAPSVSIKNQKTNKTNKKTQPKKTAIMNVVLPGKVARTFSNSQAARAQKVVRRVQTRKQSSSSKNGAFVVRKPFVSRKN